MITDNVNTVFLNLPGSHRDMMRVPEIIVAFVRHTGSIHRLMESRIFLVVIPMQLFLMVATRRRGPSDLKEK